MLTEGSLEKISRCSMEFEEDSLGVKEKRVHIVRRSFPIDLQEQRSRWLRRGQTRRGLFSNRFARTEVSSVAKRPDRILQFRGRS